MKTIGDPVYRQHAIPAGEVGSETLLLERDVIPFPHYRYLAKEHCDSFFEDGSLRLGTIYGYGKQGDFEGFRFDENEGRISFTTNDADIWDVGGPVIYSVVCHNAYTMCVSKHLSLEVADLFNNTSCLAIQSIEFYLEISKVVNDFVNHTASLSTIQYTSKNALARYVFDNNIDGLPEDEAGKQVPPTARTKLLKHSREHEIRAIWEPVSRQSDKINFPHGTRVTEDLQSAAFGRRMQENRLLEYLEIKVPEARKFAAFLNWEDRS